MTVLGVGNGGESGGVGGCSFEEEMELIFEIGVGEIVATASIVYRVFETVLQKIVEWYEKILSREQESDLNN